MWEWTVFDSTSYSNYSNMIKTVEIERVGVGKEEEEGDRAHSVEFATAPESYESHD